MTPSDRTPPGDASAVASAAPGWYGKLPVLGDFASRRLDAELIDIWDDWLAVGLAGLQASQGGAWLDAYLASPIWRFVLMPGALDADGSAASATSTTHAAGIASSVRAGVLMPSVDRVGRYFPLTIMSPIETPTSGAGLETLLGWLHRLDDAAADALLGDWAVDTLEAELARLAPPDLSAAAAAAASAVAVAVAAASAAASTPLSVSVSPPPSPSAAPLDPDRALSSATLSPGSRADFVQSLSLGAAGLWAAQARGLSFWLCEPADAPPRLLTCRGLPRGDRFATLFGAATASGIAATAPRIDLDRQGS